MMGLHYFTKIQRGTCPFHLGAYNTHILEYNMRRTCHARKGNWGHSVLVARYAGVTTSRPPVYNKILKVREMSSKHYNEAWIVWVTIGSTLAFLNAEHRTATSCEIKEDGRILHAVKQIYDFEQLLGEGAYGKVFQARRKVDGLMLALKTIQRGDVQDEEFQREANTLRILSQNGGHPNVCRLFDEHVDSKYNYLAMELMQGGELLQHLIRNGPYSEAQAAGFILQFAEGISFVHASGVTHADLKLENLIMSSIQDDDAKLKLVDFGCSVLSEESESKQRDILGTTAYWSPELCENGALPTHAADMWAVGCIVFILLTGSHPFDKNCDSTDEDIKNTLVQIKNGSRTIDEVVFDERINGLSDSCVQMMKKLMDPDPNKRMTSNEFLRHPWVQGLTASWDKIDYSDQKLEVFWRKRFQAEMHKKFLKGAKGNGSFSEENLREMFCSLDLDGNGVLDAEEIQVFLSELGIKDEDISQIFGSLDLDGSGEIELDEFRAIMRTKFENGPGLRTSFQQSRFRADIFKQFAYSSNDKKQSFEDDLHKIFDAIDLDGNGILDPQELRVALRSAGQTEQSISEIIASMDVNHDGGVDWEEFRDVMRKRENDS
jgi:calcium-dependent protein kinase